MEKPTPTDHPIHPLIACRWSPRAFADSPVSDADLRALLEAARWAPSSRNERPWRFIVARRADDPGAFGRILDCLAEGNRVWARHAAALMVAVARTHFAYKERPNLHHAHDVGQALAMLSIEATARELWLHQMGGFDRDCVREAFAVPEGFEPLTAVAIGHMGQAADLPAPLDEREGAPRARHPLSELVFGATWGEPSPLLDTGAKATRDPTD